MPENVEIKAIAPDPAAVRMRAEELSRSRGELLRQEDTFFHAARGRLKLREIEQAGRHDVELIYYDRPDAAGPKVSRFIVAPLADAAPMKALLTLALGVKGTVGKERRLYLIGQTRVHLDRVETLGDFVELEVVLREGQTAADGRQIASDLMAKLGISPNDLRPGAYLDLMQTP